MGPRIGFLGAGLIAHFHALGLHTSGRDHQIGPVHDPNRPRAEEFTAGWGGFVVDTESEVLDGADAVYIVTWTSEHARLVSEAVRRGLPVFCEKPLAFDGDAAARMAATVERAGVVNRVGLVLRSSPAYALLRHLVEDPAAGRVMSVVFRDDQYIPTQGMYASDWRGDRERAGAGTMLEHAIHDVDLLEFCFGPVRSVSSRSANFHGHDGIEDSVASVFDLESGAVGVHTTIWHDVLERPSLRRIEVFCERRHIVVENDHDGPIRWTTTGDGDTELHGTALTDHVNALGLLPENPDGAFLDAVTSGRPTSPTLRDAVRAHRLVDAVYASAAAGGAPVEPEP